MTSENYQVTGPMNLTSELRSGNVGRFRLKYFEFSGADYYVVEKGTIQPESSPLVRIVSACSIGHLFNSMRCDCRIQLDLALEKIEENGLGLLIYAFNHEGRGVGSRDHVRAHMKQDEGLDTVESYLQLGLPVDRRDYSDIIEIITSYGVSSIRLLTNNPRKLDIFDSTGIVVERVPLEVKIDQFNAKQLETKKRKLGHMIS